ncbi:MAG: M23 family metallopeptidase [Deltaproteobacteria bacterium]|nr:M23 family metallopeptidase [Deltaproteobacteria bacterium]
MKKRYLTIFFLSGDSSKMRQLRMPYSVYLYARNTLAVFLAVAVVFFAYISFDYTSLVYKASLLSDVKKENLTQKLELQRFAAKIREIETTLSRLKLFDKKLRIMANLDKAPSDGRVLMGMGGPEGEDGGTLSLADKKDELIKGMHSTLDELSVETKVRGESLVELQSYFLEKSALLSSTPSIWPTRGWVSSGFGKRDSPFSGLRHMHRGIDIANNIGTPVVATADGVVSEAGVESGFGKIVTISHGYGMKTIYGHLSMIKVAKGERIKRGQVIAEMGNSGRSTGPHLHYEVALNGVSVNPMKYIVD